MDECRQSVQHGASQSSEVQRKAGLGRKARRLLRSGKNLLTNKENGRVASLFTDTVHTAVEVAWGAYHRVVAAHRHTDRAKGRKLMEARIVSVQEDMPAGPVDVRRLGRPLKCRAAEVLARLYNGRSSDGPIAASNEQIEGSSRLRV